MKKTNALLVAILFAITICNDLHADEKRRSRVDKIKRQINRNQEIVASIQPVDLAKLAQDNRDDDQDGILNDRERYFGINPRNPDTDGDGFDDRQEIRLGRIAGFDPLVMTRDSDQDGLADEVEKQLGSDLNNIDTDNDKLSDYDEFIHQ